MKILYSNGRAEQCARLETSIPQDLKISENQVLAGDHRLVTSRRKKSQVCPNLVPISGNSGASEPPLQSKELLKIIDQAAVGIGHERNDTFLPSWCQARSEAGAHWLICTF